MSANLRFNYKVKLKLTRSAKLPPLLLGRVFVDTKAPDVGRLAALGIRECRDVDRKTC